MILASLYQEILLARIAYLIYNKQPLRFMKEEYNLSNKIQIAKLKWTHGLVLKESLFDFCLKNS
jgi:hypothetical protein